MSDVFVETQDKSLPPAAEYETVMDWLSALPPYTTMVLTFDGHFPTFCLVEDLIDGLALGPIVNERIRGLLEDG